MPSITCIRYCTNDTSGNYVVIHMSNLRHGLTINLLVEKYRHAHREL